MLLRALQHGLCARQKLLRALQRGLYARQKLLRALQHGLRAWQKPLRALTHGPHARGGALHRAPARVCFRVVVSSCALPPTPQKDLRPTPARFPSARIWRAQLRSVAHVPARHWQKPASCGMAGEERMLVHRCRSGFSARLRPTAR